MENQRVTTTEKTPEEIEHEMQQTRESLTEKVAALENRVVGTVKTAADTLTGTVESVKELVSSAPSAVSDTVKQAASVVSETMRKAFNIPGHVRAHPWAVVGVSAGLGFLTGMLIFRPREPSERRAPPSPATLTPPAPAPSGPGVFDEMIGMLGRKVRAVVENVIDTATAAVNQNVRDSVPKLVDAAAERLTPDTDATPRPGERVGYRG